MTYLDLIRSAEYRLDKGHITLGRYEEMIEPLKREIQPEPHEGHWIGGDGSYICSECGSNPIDFINTTGASFDAYVEIPMDYCPSCGADMRGGNIE